MRGVFQNESLRPDKLRDNALSRSTLPLGRAATTGLSRRSRCRIDSTQVRANRPPLRRRRWPKKWKRHQEKVTTQKGTMMYSPIAAPSRGGAPFPSHHRLDGRFIHRPLLDVRHRPTTRWTCGQNTTAINQRFSSLTKMECKTKKVRCTLESVCTNGTSSGSGGLL